MHWKPGKLAKNTSLMTLGMGLRAVTQGLTFIIIARALGSTGYGAFISVLALASLLASIVGFGSQMLLLRDLALDKKNFDRAWGITLTSTALSIPVIFPAYIALANAFTHSTIGWKVICFIGIAEIICWPLSNMCIYAYQGLDRIVRTNHILIIPVFFRFLAALLFLYLSINKSNTNILFLWSVLYLVSAMASAAYTQYLVYHNLGRASFPKPGIVLERIKESIPFSFWTASDRLYCDADKLMLARMSTLDITGIYSAGYRAIEIFIVPIHGLIGAAASQLFRAGQSGTAHSFSYALSLIKIPLVYVTCVALVIYSMGSSLVLIIGNDYVDAVNVLYYLAWLPFVILPRLLLQSALASSGRQKTGMATLAAGATLNVALNIWLIPIYNWKGAALSTYIAEIIMTLMIALPYSHLIKTSTKEKEKNPLLPTQDNRITNKIPDNQKGAIKPDSSTST